MSGVQTVTLAPARPEAPGRGASGFTARLARCTLGLARTGVGFVLDCQQLARERRALRGMDARMLADLGLSRDGAACEARRPFFEQLREVRRR